MSIVDDTKKSLFQTKITIEIDEKWKKNIFLSTLPKRPYGQAKLSRTRVVVQFAACICFGSIASSLTIVSNYQLIYNFISNEY